MYYVWKRSDNHVGVSTYMPKDFTNAKGFSLKFEKLAEFSDWNKATTDFIEAADKAAKTESHVSA